MGPGLTQNKLAFWFAYILKGYLLILLITTEKVVLGLFGFVFLAVQFEKCN